MNANRERIALTLIRASYLVFGGFVLMLPLIVVASSIAGRDASMTAAAVLYLFALIWQIATVVLNPIRAIAWMMLIGYVGFALIPLIGALLGSRV